MIPFEPMWAQLKRLIKPRGAIVLTASQPFTSALIMSNIKMFKYCNVWEKNKCSGFMHAKNKPLNLHEDILFFSRGIIAHESKSEIRMSYYPQGLRSYNKIKDGRKKSETDTAGHRHGRPCQKEFHIQENTGYPGSIIKIASESNTEHPTQKPVALMEYLIKTYTQEGETVLDFTMGSGTSGVACKHMGRDFIGIELDPGYFKIAKERIEATVRQFELF